MRFLFTSLQKARQNYFDSVPKLFCKNTVCALCDNYFCIISDTLSNKNNTDMKPNLSPFFTHHKITTDVLRASRFRTAVQLLYFYYDIYCWYYDRICKPIQLHRYLLTYPFEDDNPFFSLYGLDFPHDSCTTYLVPYAKEQIPSNEMSCYIQQRTALHFFNGLFIFNEHITYVALLYTFSDELLSHVRRNGWNPRNGILLINCETLDITRVDSMEECISFIESVCTDMCIQTCHIARL